MHSENAQIGNAEMKDEAQNSIVWGYRPQCLLLKIHFFFNLTGMYLLSVGESYGPTAQHLQDCPIFFIQLTYVHKSK